MKFECHQVEDLEFWWAWGWSRLFFFFDLKSNVFSPGVDHEQLLLSEVPLFEKRSTCSSEIFAIAVQEHLYIAQAMKQRICVHSELPKHMPFSQCKQKVKDSCIMGFRKKPFKDRDCTLQIFFWVICCELFRNILCTWRMSSKFWAASFFILETFSPKRRIVDRPKVGISLYRRLSIWTAVSPCTTRIHIKWVKTDFQTPNSNSCMKSTANIWNKFNPNFDKHVKAF